MFLLNVSLQSSASNRFQNIRFSYIFYGWLGKMYFEFESTVRGITVIADSGPLSKIKY